MAGHQLMILLPLLLPPVQSRFDKLDEHVYKLGKVGGEYYSQHTGDGSCTTNISMMQQFYVRVKVSTVRDFMITRVGSAMTRLVCPACRGLQGLAGAAGEGGHL